METIDCRGMACPEPVILAKKALAESDELIVLVSGRDAAENVADMALNNGAVAEIAQVGNEFSVAIKRDPSAIAAAHSTSCQCQPSGKTIQTTVWVVNSDAIGQGDDELGRLLRKSFFGALAESAERPNTVLFVNSGVKLVVDDSGAIDSLKALADAGTELLACGTCLDFFGVKDKVAVGKVSNMYTLIELLMAADKTITF